MGRLRTSLTTPTLSTPEPRAAPPVDSRLHILAGRAARDWADGESPTEISRVRESVSRSAQQQQFGLPILCLFKMVEAMLKRRARLATEARRAGKPFTRKYETVPATTDAAAITWLNAIFSIRPNWDPTGSCLVIDLLVPNLGLNTLKSMRSSHIIQRGPRRRVQKFKWT